MNKTDLHITDFERKFNNLRTSEPILPDEESFEVMARKFRDHAWEPHRRLGRQLTGWVTVALAAAVALWLVLTPFGPSDKPLKDIARQYTIQPEDLNMNRIDETTLLEAIEEADPEMDIIQEALIADHVSEISKNPTTESDPVNDVESISYDEILDYLLNDPETISADFLIQKP